MGGHSNNEGFEHKPEKKFQDFSFNYDLKLKSTIGGNYLGEQTSKLLVRQHHLDQKKQTLNLNPINPPSAGRNSKSTIDIDLVSCLRRNWLSTNRRGKPGKSIVHFQSKPVNKTLQIIIPPITKKRNLELNHSKDIDKPGENLTIPMKSALNKLYFCSSCNKEFDSYFAFGGHRAFHVREERKWRRYSPSWAALLYGHPPPGFSNHYCSWCKKGFSNRQGLAAHSRFCYKKKRHMPTGNCKKPEVARNFDLNQLPAEAFLPH